MYTTVSSCDGSSRTGLLRSGRRLPRKHHAVLLQSPRVLDLFQGVFPQALQLLRVCTEHPHRLLQRGRDLRRRRPPRRSRAAAAVAAGDLGDFALDHRLDVGHGEGWGGWGGNGGVRGSGDR